MEVRLKENQQQSNEFEKQSDLGSMPAVRSRSSSTSSRERELQQPQNFQSSQLMYDEEQMEELQNIESVIEVIQTEIASLRHELPASSADFDSIQRFLKSLSENKSERHASSQQEQREIRRLRDRVSFLESALKKSRSQQDVNQQPERESDEKPLKDIMTTLFIKTSGMKSLKTQ